MRWNYLTKKMLCPFCLEKTRFVKSDSLRFAGDDEVTINVRQRMESYACPKCDRVVPRMYVEDYDDYPPVIISAIGFSTHGKSVYLGCSYYSFDNKIVAKHWPGFNTLPLNERGITHIHELGYGLCRDGILPELTAVRDYPIPTMFRMEGTPNHYPCTLLFYDTAGENFQEPHTIGEYASYVKSAETALFFVRLNAIEKESRKLLDLLDIYIMGMSQMGAQISNQHLVVVYTAADELKSRFVGRWEELSNYLSDRSLDSLGRPDYATELNRISWLLANYTADELGEEAFLQKTKRYFRSVTFSLVSALGKTPVEVRDEETGISRMADLPEPQRILDPILIAIDRARMSK